MSDKTYTVAVILTIPADSYEDALDRADEIVEELEAGDAGVGYSAVREYEHDNEGQRVLYLDPVAEELEPDEGGAQEPI